MDQFLQDTRESELPSKRSSRHAGCLLYKQFPVHEVLALSSSLHLTSFTTNILSEVLCAIEDISQLTFLVVPTTKSISLDGIQTPQSRPLQTMESSFSDERGERAETRKGSGVSNCLRICLKCDSLIYQDSWAWASRKSAGSSRWDPKLTSLT